MNPPGVFGHRLALAALAYALLHHLGTLPPVAVPAGTRLTDWLDLLVPYLVLAAVAGALLAAPPSPRRWAGFALGAVAYVQGHGVHLAANSIGNAAAGPVAHLWDERVGHLIWYSGVALLTAVLGTAARTFSGPRTRAGRGGAVLLALAVGATWTSNALGGDGTVLPALAVALGLTGYAARHRHTLAGYLIPAFAPAALALALAAFL